MHQAIRAVLDSQREMKFQTETTSASTAVDGAVFELTQNIVQGDGSTNRDGAQINLVKLKIRFEALLNNSATTDFVRLIIFSDTQSNGVAPVVTDVLVSADPNSSLSANVLIIKRFKILLDKTWGMSTGAVTRAVQLVQDINMRGIKVSYLGTTDATGANGRNSCWALIISDEAVNQSAFVLDVGMLFHDS